MATETPIRPARPALRPVWWPGASRYVAAQYPPAQAGAVGIAALTSYAAYGRLAGDMTVDATGLVAAVTVTLLFLQLRLIDDLTVWCNTHDLAETSGATACGLAFGLVGTSTVVAAANAAVDARMLGAALGATLAMAFTLPATIGERRWPPLLSLVLGRLPLFELCPAAILAYTYLAWHVAAGRTLPWTDVAAVVGLLWCCFSVWKFTRHLGERAEERIYRMSWPVVRVVTVLLLAVCLALVAVLTAHAHLPRSFLIWAIGLTAVFAVLARPRRTPDSERPAWAGLPYPAAMLGGLALELLVLGV